MPGNINALFIAWAASLILVVGGVLLIDSTYDPEEAMRAQAEAEAAAAKAKAEAEKDAQAEANTPKEEETILSAADTVVDLGAEAHEVPLKAIPDLVEEHVTGPLPKIAEDGRTSYNVYAAAKPRDRTKPRIAIMITGLGLKLKLSEKTIADLPSQVSLAFSPYSGSLHKFGEVARQDGHEVFLEIPMEPTNYPQNDPGDLSLLTSYTSRENINMLRSSLARMSAYVGITNYMGSRFTAASESMKPVLDELKKRGLMFVDSRTTPYSRAGTMARAVGVPVAINNGYIDDNVDQDIIAEELLKLEKRAQVQGAAMGIGRPFPVTSRAILAWAETLEERGFELVPVTSIANMQALPR